MVCRFLHHKWCKTPNYHLPQYRPIECISYRKRRIPLSVKHFFFVIHRNSLIQQEIEVARKHLFLPSFLLF